MSPSDEPRPGLAEPGGLSRDERVPSRHEVPPRRGRALFVDHQGVLLDEADVALDAAQRSSGGETTPSKRNAGADVHTAMGSAGSRSRTARSTSAVRVECPNPCPET